MAITKIQSESLNLADTYDFTGTVTGAGGVNTPAFFVYKNTSQTLNDETDTKVTWTTERFDTDNAFSSNKFTVPSGQAGKYFFAFHSHVYDANEELRQVNRSFRKNGGYTGSVDNTFDTAVVVTNNVPITTIIDLSVGDYIETYVWGNTADNGTFQIYGEGLNYTYFYGYKIIE